MKSTFVIAVASTMFLCALNTEVHAAYTIKNGHLVDVDEVATLPIEEHYEAGLEAMKKSDWKESARQFRIVSNSFPNTPYGQEAYYYLGVSDYKLGEYDFANDAFSQYLKAQNNPKFFLNAIEYKFAIAEKFKNGAKRRFFGTKQLPKWATGRTLGLKIYDEVIAAMPSHDIAARALYAKGCLLWELKNYRESVEAFQMVTKRFSKHELAPECYLLIARVYLEQSKCEFQNPDILAFAQINLRRFKQEFPREERIVEAEQDVLWIKEVYAKGLYDAGQFYERINQPQASVIYYQNAIQQFPDTSVAELCKQRLYRLNPNLISIESDETAVDAGNSKPQVNLQQS